MSRYEITEEQWEKIKWYFPQKQSKRGRPGKSDRKMLNAILWIAHSGAAWRDLPERYGSWKTVYSRFTKWRDGGVFEKIFEGVSSDADFENLGSAESIDKNKNTIIREIKFLVYKNFESAIFVRLKFQTNIFFIQALLFFLYLLRCQITILK